MAMTPAQRQAAYRKRHRSTKSRINSLVSNVAKMNLFRLARRYGITESAMLERLINNATNNPKDPSKGMNRYRVMPGFEI